MASSDADRHPLERLADEYVERRRRGDQCTVEEYAAQYPDLAAQIRELFPALAVMEQLKPGPDDRTGTFGGRVSMRSPLPKRLGDYQILREIGRGGMGVVYEAEQASLGRHVALKVLSAHALLEPKHVRRFQREAKAAARLHHSNIVPVFGVGEQDSLHYYVMQYITGLGLDQVLRELRALHGQNDNAERLAESEDKAAPQPPLGPHAGPAASFAHSQRATAANIAQALLSGQLRLDQPPRASDSPPPVHGRGDDSPTIALPDSSSSDDGPTAPESPSHSAGRPAPAGSSIGPAGPDSASSGPRRRDGGTTCSSSESTSGDGNSGRLRFREVSSGTRSGASYWRSIARIGVQVAEALDYAHVQGTLHRDIKPSNLLLDNRGTVWVTDFGLAKIAGEGDLTHTGDIIGTLRYLPPEALRGEFDHRSDVYSLGLTLYELLTLQPACNAQDRRELIRQVSEAQPPRPRKLVPDVPRDLETIVLKAISRERAHRYQTAGELAEDLQRFLDDKPIQARRVGMIERAWRWSCRNPLLATLAVSLVLAVVTGFALVMWQWLAAEKQTRIANTAAAEARYRLGRQYVNNGVQAAQRGDPIRGLVWLAEALNQDWGDAQRSEVYLRRLGIMRRQMPSLLHLLAHPGPIDAATFTPDGKYAIIDSGTSLRIWNAWTGQPVSPVHSHPEEVWKVIVSPDSRYAAAMVLPANLPGGDAPYDGFVYVYDVPRGELACPPRKVVKLLVWPSNFTADSRHILVGDQQRLYAIDVTSGQDALPPLELPGLGHFKLSPKGRWLLTQSAAPAGQEQAAQPPRTRLQLYDAQSFQPIGQPIDGEEVTGFGEPFSEDGEFLITVRQPPESPKPGLPGYLSVWRVEDGQRALSLAAPRAIHWAALTPDANLVLAWDAESNILAWELATARPVSVDVAERFQYGSSDIRFSPDGKRLAIPASGKVVLLSLEENNEAGGAPASESTLKLRTLDQPTIDGFAHNIHFSPDGQRLLVAAQVDNKAEIHVLDLLTGERWGTEVLHRYGTIDAQFSSDGQRLLTYGEDGVARIWNLIPSEPSWRPLLGLNDQGISCLAISPSGRFLAIGQGHHDMSVERGGGEAYGYLQAWDWATRRAVGPQIKFDSRVVQITFGHDERYATVRLSYDTAAVVDLVTGKILLQVGNPGKEAILSAVLRRDGRLAVISAPRDPQWPWNISTNPTRLYTQPVPAIPQTNLIAGKVNVVWSGPEFSRQHALLGPDGIWYLFVRDDGSAIVGRTLGAGGQIRLDRLYGKLTAAAYSHDGQKLVTVSDEGIAVIWDLEVGQPAAPLIRGAKSAKFSHDGRFLLTMGGEPYGAQVWDVATGEPLSLPIRTQSLPLAPSRQAEPELGPGGNFLISTAGDQLALWDFRPLQLPPQEVTLWAQAIAGHRIDEFGGDVPLDAREVAAAWKSYTQGHGLAERAPSKETIQQWHVRRAKEHEVVAQQYAYPWNAQQHGMESGFHFAARWHLTALLESDPNNAAYHYRRGNAQVALGHYAAAVADFSNALSLGYTKWEALFGRAVAHHELGRAEEASADMAAAIEQGCDESDYNLDEWQVRAAIAGLTRLLQRMPGDDGLLQRRAKLHWGLDHWAEALADYDALIAQDKEGTWHHWYLYRRGDCYAGLKQWDKAVADYTQALKKRTDDPDILQRRAMAYFELGHFEKAADDLAKVRGRLSSPQDVIYHEALLRLLLGDPEGQYGLLCAQVSLDTSKAYSEPQELAQSAWIWLVGKSAPASYEPIVTRLRGLMSGAGSTSQQVATRPEIPGNSGTPSESAPISVSNAYQFFLARALGTALYRDGNPTEAMGYFAASHRFSPQDPSVQYLLAMAHQDLGQAEEAASWLDMANSHFNSAYERLSFADRLLNSVLRRQATEGLQPSPE